MTYWLELLVKVSLRYIVQKKFGVRTGKCMDNPFDLETEWECADDQWATAVFAIAGGSEIEIDFKPTMDPQCGRNYVDPLEIKPKNVRLIETRKPMASGERFTTKNGLTARYYELSGLLKYCEAARECLAVLRERAVPSSTCAYAVRVGVAGSTIWLVYNRQRRSYKVIRSLKTDMRMIDEAAAIIYGQSLYLNGSDQAKIVAAGVQRGLPPKAAALVMANDKKGDGSI